MWKDPVPARRRRLILGIETSCDETAAALVTRDGELARTSSPRRPSCTRASAASCPRSPRAGTSSSSRPSCARRSGRPTRRSRTSSAVAVTAGPGLIGALLVGVSAAKALAWARRLPLAPVDHLHGHVASLYLQPARRSSRRSSACSRAAGTRCCSTCASAAASRCSGRRSTTRPARRSTRARGCSGSATRAARRSTGSRARATPRRSTSRSRACPASTSPSRA